MKEKNQVNHVYIRDVERCYVPALQLKTHQGKATVAVPVFKNEQEIMHCGKQGKQKYEDNQIIDLNEYPNRCLPMQNVDANGRLEDYKDMVSLPFLHEVSRFDFVSMAFDSSFEH